MTDPLTPKPWYTSWVLWFNALSAVVVIAGIFIDPTLGFDPRIVAVATAVITAGNAALRILKTMGPIAGTPPAAQVEMAKQNIALNAALDAAPPPH